MTLLSVGNAFRYSRIPPICRALAVAPARPVAWAVEGRGVHNHRKEVSMEDNAAIARRLYEHWNARDFEASAALATDDCEILIVGSGARFRGPDGVREYSRMWADAFPDGRVTIDRVCASGDCVCVEFTGRGTQTGALRLSTGEIPATGRSVTLTLCDVHEFRGGKIASSHTYLDSASLLMQLGVMPELRAAATT
jgi:steroid delta-isomerase-like uncharacterized protein